MTDFDPREARLSEWARCPRACACRIAGHEPAPPTEHQERYFRRGQLFGLYVAAQFKAKYADVVTEMEIPWPLGTGHADIYVPSEDLIVEVFSSTGTEIGHKIKQVRLYGYFREQLTGSLPKLAVYVVDPSTLDREDSVPVKLTAGDREEIERELDSLLGVFRGGVDLPPCAFSTPTECKFSGCAFTASAWEGWAPDEAELEEAVPLVQHYMDAKAAEDEANKEYRIRRELREAAKEALIRAGLDAGRGYIIGPYKVTRTIVGPRHTFSLATARKAGYDLPEHLLPFVKVGEGHERLSIREIGEAP